MHVHRANRQDLHLPVLCRAFRRSLTVIRCLPGETLAFLRNLFYNRYIIISKEL